MTVLPASPVAPAFDRAPAVAIPRQSRGAHRVRETQVRPAVRGAAAAAYAITARAGSLTTLAAMLVLGGAVAASTDDTVPSGAAATTATTLQGP